MRGHRSPVVDAEERDLRARWLAAAGAGVLAAIGAALFVGTGGAPGGIALTSPPGSTEIDAGDAAGREVAASPLAALSALILPAPPGPGPAIPGPDVPGLTSQDGADAAVVGVDDTTTSSSTSSSDTTATSQARRDGGDNGGTVPLGNDDNYLVYGDCGSIVLGGQTIGCTQPRRSR